jgi:hypothetical protein
MTLLKALWQATFGPIYNRLFRRYYQAMLGELGRVEAELRNQNAAVRSHSAAIVDYGVELRTHLDQLYGRLAELDERVRIVIASQWEQQAIVRRIAGLEDALEQVGARTQQVNEEASTPGGADSPD